MPNTCEFVLRQGARRGEACGKNALSVSLNGHWYCRRHHDFHVDSSSPHILTPSPSLRCGVLVSYASDEHRGVPLADVYDWSYETSPQEETCLRHLNGYLNFKLGTPVFVEGESLPLVIMAKHLGKDHLTKKDIAVHVKETIDYILTRPDVYAIAGYAVQEMILKNIRYDNEMHMLRATIEIL